MKRTSVMAIALLIVLVALLSGLAACDKGGTLSVSFDETVQYTLDEVNESVFRVELVSGSKRSKVAYSIKSATPTEDGAYIEVVIAADGLEETVLLPRAEEPTFTIRPELQGLYELFKDDGDKACAITLSGGAKQDKDSERTSFGLKAVVNLPKEGEAEFALLGGAGEEADVLAYYDNALLSLGGLTLERARIEAFLSEVLAYFGQDMSAITDFSALGKDFIFAGTADAADTAFASLSAMLDAFDAMTARSMAPLLGITLTKTEGGYTLSADSKKFVNFVKIFLTEKGQENALFNMILAEIDTRVDGAFKKGEVTVTASVTATESGVSASLSFSEEEQGYEADFSLAFDASAAPFSLPESVQASAQKDVEIIVPIALPQKGINLTVNAVLHTSDMFSGEGKDILTATLSYNDMADAAHFILNGKYIYLDAGNLAERFYQQRANAVFYRAFDEEITLSALLDVISDMFKGEEDESSLDAAESATGEGEDETLGDAEANSFLTEILRHTNFADPETGEVRVANAIAALADAIISEREKFESTFLVERTEKGLRLSLVINEEGEEDFLSILNLFAGIPDGEGGRKDFDEDTLADILSDVVGKQIPIPMTMISQMLLGVNLTDMLADIRLVTTVSWDDGLSLGVALNDSEGNGYLSGGVSVGTTEGGAEIAAPTEDEIAAAKGFETASSMGLTILMMMMLY